VQPRAWPRIAVMGAGAVGSYFGGMLALAGAPVTLIGRPRHVEVIAREGLWIESARFRGPVSVAASTEAAAARGAEMVLLSVKAGDTSAAARALAPHLLPSAVVLSLQNGVDNVSRIRAHVGNPVVPAVVYVAVEISGPGRVRHNGRGDLVIGTPRGESPCAALEEIVGLFARAGIPCRVSADIEADQWEKLAMNCAFNAISALGRARYGRIMAHPGARALLKEAVDEVAAVARAEGIDLGTRDLGRAAEALASAMPDALSSTAQDVALGKRTEIDDLNGHVAARGAALGVPTPVNRALQALVSLLGAAGPAA
jgi:2-dehydropantoate 2-reductase